MSELVTSELKVRIYELFEQHDKIVEEQDEYIEQLRERNKRLQSENTRLKALADNQCDNCACEIANERDKLTEYIIKLIKKHDDDLCSKCKNHIECKGEDFDNYISGIGATGQDGEEYLDFKWTCEDFDLGTCNKLQNTPCNGCFDDDYKGFAWRGLEE